MSNSQKSALVINVDDLTNAYMQAIDEEHKAILREVRMSALNHAIKGLPGKDEASIETSIREFRAMYGRMATDYRLKLSEGIRTKLGALSLFSLQQKIKDLKLKAITEASALETLKAAAKKYIGQRTQKEFDAINRKLKVCAVLETLGYILSYSALGDNPLLAAIFGLITGGLQVYGIQSLCLWLRDGAGAKLSLTTKRIIWAAVAVFATGVGLLRYATVEADAKSATHSTVILIFFIIFSLFLISVVALYVSHHWPTPDELATMQKAIKAQEELDNSEKSLADYNAKINELTDECATVAQVHTLLIHSAKSLHFRINHHFEQAVGVFISENRINRTDGIEPACFLQPVQPLARPNYDALNEEDTNFNNVTEPVV